MRLALLPLLFAAATAAQDPRSDAVAAEPAPLVCTSELAPFLGWIRAGRAPTEPERAGIERGVTAGLGLPAGVRFSLGPGLDLADVRAGDTAVLVGALVGERVVGWPEEQVACRVTVELGDVWLAGVELVDPGGGSAWVRERAATSSRWLHRAALDEVLAELLAAGRAVHRREVVVHELTARAVDPRGSAPALELDARLLAGAGLAEGALEEGGWLDVYGLVRLSAAAARRPAPAELAQAGASRVPSGPPVSERPLGDDVERVLALVEELRRWPLPPWTVQGSVREAGELFVWAPARGPDDPDGARGEPEAPFDARGFLALGVRDLDPAAPDRARAWWDEVEVDLDAARAAFGAAAGFAAREGDALAFLAAFPPEDGDGGLLLAAATPPDVSPWRASAPRVAAVRLDGSAARELEVERAFSRPAGRTLRVHLAGGGFVELVHDTGWCVTGGPLLPEVSVRLPGGGTRRGRLVGGTCGAARWRE